MGQLWTAARGGLVVLLTPLLLLGACSDPPPAHDADADTSDADEQPDRDADEQPDRDADDPHDADPDSDRPVRTGLAGRSGTATITAAGYVGSEDWFFIGDEGAGANICLIRYQLTTVGAALTDCGDCEWAYELILSAAEVVEESDVGCRATLDVDPAAIAALNGRHLFYGFASDYMGHGTVLMSRTESTGWIPECFATYDAATGAFSYQRTDGYTTY